MRSGRLIASMLIAVLGWASAPGVARAAEMNFQIIQMSPNEVCGRDCVQIISGQGEITEETSDRFLQFASANVQSSRTRNVLFLDSPGGNVVGSLQLGKVLRRLGTAVVIARVLSGPYGGEGVLASGRCMSACVYAMMGGAKRIVPPSSIVGIHRMFRKEREYDFIGRNTGTKLIYAPDAMVAALTHYTDSMGVSRGLVARAETISPLSVHIVTRKELRRWHLGTSRF